MNPHPTGLRLWVRRGLATGILGLALALFAREQFGTGSGAGLDEPGVIDAGRKPAIGQPAPDFALERLGTGELVRLSDLRGKTVLVNFWATWCAPCRVEMPEFEALYRQRASAGDFVILSVDDSEPDADVQEFVDAMGLTFPVVLDRAGEVRAHYGAVGLPASFFIDAGGVLRQRNLGPVLGDLLKEGVAAADAGR